ncbi:MAG: hypothetical protein AB1324_05610 [Candidatus Micrarchaeota archaeon]
MPEPRKSEPPSTGAKVIDLAERRRAREKTMGEPPMAAAGARKITRAECMERLSEIAPVSQDVLGLLGLPQEIYLVSPAPASFSTDSGKTIAGVASALMFDSALPSDMPEYGVHISPQGSNVFCTLVDKKRKIIVCESISNMYAPNGSFVAFSDSVRDALDAVREQEAGGEPFSFIIFKDSVSRVV